MAAITVEDVPQLNIDRLRKGNYVNEGGIGDGTYQAVESDPVLHLLSDLRTEDRVLRIKYEKLNSKEWMEYEIQIEAVPTVLGNGKGKNVYWVCPVSGTRCKILYYDIQNHLFVCRSAYSQPLYYPIQSIGGKVERVSANIDIQKERLIKCFLQLKRTSYGGRATNTIKQIRKLQNKKHLLEMLELKHMERGFSVWERKFN